MKNRNNIQSLSKFNLGQLLVTREVLRSCSFETIVQCLSRHIKGDWGNLGEEDIKSNEEALKQGGNILSAYPIDPAKPYKDYNRLWIITEADRSYTTLRLPNMY